MTQQPDEKKSVIVPLIDRMRIYNPAFGSYERSMLNLDYNYSVKLSNGRIDISSELINAFEANASSISEEKLKIAAAKFIPDFLAQYQTQSVNHNPIESFSKPNESKPKPAKKRKSIGFWIGIVLLLFIVYKVIYRNDNSFFDGSSASAFSSSMREKTPEELRLELLSKERGSPNLYLQNEGTCRENLIGRKVLEGTISNSATIANFKDIVLEVTWLTKTQTVLSVSKYTIYEYVGAGKSINYKIKDFAPNETQAFRARVLSATPVN